MKVAVVGATGAVGRQMLLELEAVTKVEHVELLASSRSAGRTLQFRGQELKVQSLDSIQSRESGAWDVVLMSAGSEVSLQTAEIFCQKGAVVIDNSRAFRDTHLLVVPGVNDHVLESVKSGTIIANPNCSTIQMVMALKPLQTELGLKKVHVATYQAVSGAGEKGRQELSSQLENPSNPIVNVFQRPIVSNLIPWIGGEDESGYCEEEIKMIKETRKILEQPQLEIEVTTVRVPVMNAHSEVVFVECEKSATRDEFIEILSRNTVVYKNLQDAPDPRNISGDARVHVGRIRIPYGVERSSHVQFWNVADNLRKGAATNAVEILTQIQL